MKPLELDGIIYDQDGTQTLINHMIRVRNEAMQRHDWENTVLLSHVIALLNYYKDQLA
jgi:hypothetical protein